MAEQKESSAGEEETDCIILAMRQYVDKDPAAATLAGAAQAAYLSASYASRYFKQRIGMGFSEYVLEQKMRLAAELLAQPQHRIYEVSEQMGYMNPVNFARAFRRHYHVSPHDYRSQKLGRSVPGEERDK
ncbi:MAG: helix-turn-helix transcriptional regulator [Lacrimispora sp.]